MKKIYFILCLILFLGCNNSNNEKSIEYSEMEDVSVETISINDNADVIKKPNYNQLSVIEEKLQESYDLIYLSEKNSDFESTRKPSSIIIQNIILDSINNQNSPTVNNIHQIGSIETLNDSTTQIKFSYTIKQHNSTKTDTLKAIIQKRNITIEGQTTTSIKIDFAKYDD